MTSKEQAILLDMAAFIAYAMTEEGKGMSFGTVLATLGHDVGGLLSKDECFSPRTNRYASVIAKLRKEGKV